MSYMFSFQYLLFLCYFWWPRFSLRLLPGQFGNFSCGLCFDFSGFQGVCFGFLHFWICSTLLFWWRNVLWAGLEDVDPPDLLTSELRRVTTSCGQLQTNILHPPEPQIQRDRVSKAVSSF